MDNPYGLSGEIIDTVNPMIGTFYDPNAHRKWMKNQKFRLQTDSFHPMESIFPHHP
jgi:hypothetical protein